ncbi:hypothetical protein Godav_009939 [Gossypium davidsonii]|uniref:MADS-box domain-containing protein n=2 Tax=Gossypium TaxID=3633 RepID=A0A7J8SEU7_GOSDV|nr:hypothetical protein [Gossypium davidsonii]MBA0660206.1 hypothetical protein [Gossypium klotzschianum]
MANTGKKTKGKQNIEIKMIENDDDRLITFSKRYLFTFGLPSIESIANCFLNGNIHVIDDTHALIEAHNMVRINKVIQLYNEVRSQMDASNETQKVLAQQITSGIDSNRWWETPLDQLSPRELYEQYSHF